MRLSCEFSSRTDPFTQPGMDQRNRNSSPAKTAHLYNWSSKKQTGTSANITLPVNLAISRYHSDKSMDDKTTMELTDAWRSEPPAQIANWGIGRIRKISR